VISGKFPTVASHRRFFEALLEDLFRQVTRLSFTFSTVTAQGVRQAQRPPSPIFTLHFLLQYSRRLLDAVNLILSNPHRLLSDREERLPLAQASEIDADVVLEILHSPQSWQRASGFLLANRLGGYAPERVWQRLPEETLDTPENRFVLAFLRQVLSAADALPGQPWWSTLLPDRVRLVRDAAGNLRQAIQHPTFAEVSEMRLLPAHSRVLARREGYRQLFELWQVFQMARRPLFGPLQHAIELRDVATLYELWVFFALAKQIGDALGIAPKFVVQQDEAKGLKYTSKVWFGEAGSLLYNAEFRQNRRLRSYTLTLRPDFTWLSGESSSPPARLVFDAKFRMNLTKQELDQLGESELPEGSPLQDDLNKMHTYRDALGLHTAVSIYPGSQQVFYDWEKGVSRSFSIADLLAGRYSGVGAIPMSPAGLPASDNVMNGDNAYA
jgi:hypothetical protein